MTLRLVKDHEFCLALVGNVNQLLHVFLISQFSIQRLGFMAATAQVEKKKTSPSISIHLHSQPFHPATAPWEHPRCHSTLTVHGVPAVSRKVNLIKPRNAKNSSLCLCSGTSSNNNNNSGLQPLHLPSGYNFKKGSQVTNVARLPWKCGHQQSKPIKFNPLASCAVYCTGLPSASLHAGCSELAEPTAFSEKLFQPLPTVFSHRRHDR